MAAAIELSGVSHDFGGIQALCDIDLSVDTGERVGIVGASGAGKTTLLEIICGVLAPSRGEVRAQRAVLMPQRDLLLPWLSALDNAGLALRVAGLSREAARARARPLLERLDLGDFAGAAPDELSGGMRQRVSLLRSLLAPAAVLALDEPFAALDAITRSELHGWLHRALVGEPRTLVLVTHDVEEAVKLSDRVIVLSPRPGRIRAEVAVPLPHPRASTDPQVQERRARVLELLGAAA